MQVSWFDVTSLDSLIAFDGAQMRLTTSDLGGRLSRVLPVEPVFEANGRLLANRGGRFSDGSLLATPGAFLAPHGNETGIAHRSLLRVEEGGAPIATLGWFPHFEYVSIARGVRVPSLFGPVLAYTVSRDDRIYLGFGGDGYQIVELDPLGDTLRIIRRSHISRRIEDRHVADAVVRFGSDDQEEARRVLSLRVTASIFPPFGTQWFFDRLDRLWVPDYTELRGAQRQWSLFGSEGRWLETVVLPPEFSPNDATRTHVLGVWRDGRTDATSARVNAFSTTAVHAGQR